MAIQLNLSPQLNPAFTKDFAQLTASTKKEAFRYNLLSKITLIAVGLLGLISLAASLAVTGALSSYLLAGAIVITPLFSSQAQRCKQRALIAEEAASLCEKIQARADSFTDRVLNASVLKENYAVDHNPMIPIGCYRNTLAAYEIHKEEQGHIDQELTTLLQAQNAMAPNAAERGQEQYQKDLKKWQLLQKKYFYLFEQVWLLDLLRHPTKEESHHLMPRGKIEEVPYHIFSSDRANGRETIAYTFDKENAAICKPRHTSLSFSQLEKIRDAQELYHKLREIQQSSGSAIPEDEEKVAAHS